MSYTFEHELLEDGLVVEAVPLDSENWLTLQAQSFVPDKDSFILEEFNKKFPSNKQDDVKKIYSLANRSETVGLWLATVQTKFISDLRTPKYLEGVVDKDKVAKLDKKIIAYNDNLKKESDEIAKAASDYNKKVAEIKKRYAAERDKATEDKVLKVLTLRQNYLPLSLLVAIENYSPAEDKAPKQKAYAKELLINFQRAILSALKDNPDLDVDKLINELRPK